MVGIIKCKVGQYSKFVVLGSDQFGAIKTEVFANALLPALEPEVLESGRPAVFAGKAERVNVIFIQVAPILKRDTQLEGALHGGNEFLFLDLQQLVKNEQRWNRRLTDTDCRNFVGLNKRYVEVFSDEFRQRCGGHPARGTTTCNDHFCYLFHNWHHFTFVSLISFAYGFSALSLDRMPAVVSDSIDSAGRLEAAWRSRHPWMQGFHGCVPEYAR